MIFSENHTDSVTFQNTKLEALSACEFVRREGTATNYWLSFGSYSSHLAIDDCIDVSFVKESDSDALSITITYMQINPDYHHPLIAALKQRLGVPLHDEHRAVIETVTPALHHVSLKNEGYGKLVLPPKNGDFKMSIST